MKPTVEEVVITVSSLIEDLNNGLTWLKSEDVGNGSIEEKYGAREIQILAIKQHPKLIGKEPVLRIFKIKDDLPSDNPGSTEGQIPFIPNHDVLRESGVSGNVSDTVAGESTEVGEDNCAPNDECPQEVGSLSAILED